MPDFVPGLAGVPAARSAISFVDGQEGVLEYRGIRIETLAEQSTYEETAFLLIHGRLPKEDELRAFSEALNAGRQIPDELRDLIAAFPDDAHPMHALQTAVSALGMYCEGVDYNDPRIREDKALEIVASIPAIVAAFHRVRHGKEILECDTSLSHAADFLRMVTGEMPDALSSRVMDVALILHADHTMNASTFTARVTASTGASPFAVVSSAVGSLSGPLHGGANERVLIQLRQIGGKKKVREAVTRMIENKERIMGLGHRVYKTKDPRAIILQRMANELFEKRVSDIYNVAVEFEKVATEKLGARGIYPNVDFYSGVVYDKLGIPTDLFTPIFAVARAAGWMAHWLEQMSDNRIFRPRQVYVGEHDVSYIPISER